MSWNIAKPGDQINGPVSVTGALTSSSTVTGTQIISTIATGTAPLTVASTTNVTNLNADLLDGQQGSYYQNADNINAGTLVVGRGGTGASTFTAGRVLFGNGTSALNTSANLHWDNANNRLGIGTATPNRKLSIGGGASNSLIHFINDDTGPNNTDGFTFGLETDESIVLFNSEATPFKFYTNSNLALTLDSSGYLYTAANGRIGVGVVPTAALDVDVGTGNADALIRGTLYSNLKVRGTYNSGATGGAQLFLETTGNRTWILGNRIDAAYGTATNSFFIRDESASATRLEITTAGNLGLGVTPSAWGGGYKAFQMGSGGTSFIGGLNFSEYIQNAYWDGSQYKRVNAFAASKYYQANGAHAWYTAGSGSADSAFTFTQAMTLDASGNLLVGTTSAVEKLTIRGSGVFDDGTNGRLSLLVASTQSRLVSTTTGFGDYKQLEVNGENIRFFTGSLSAAPYANAERLRIKATGQLNFTGLAADPAGAAAGDVYYNSSTNKLRCYNGTTWNDLF